MFRTAHFGSRLTSAARSIPARRLARLLALGAAFAGCASEAGPTCAAAPHADPGPHAAGVTTLDVDGVPVEVWYPADPDATVGAPRDVYDMREALPAEMRAQIPADAPTRFETDAVREAPVAEGRFAVVLFSHGLGGFRQQSSFLGTHLAQHGFVVAAPEHPERNLAAVLAEDELSDEAVPQLRAALAALADEDARAGAILEGAVDAGRVGLVGHSAGGGAVGALVDADDFDARAWVGLATIAAPRAPVPGLIVGGTRDMLAVPETVARGYEDLPHDDKRYVSIAGAGHLAFTDICTIGRAQGGVLQIARDAGIEISDLVLQLGSDGCGPEDLPAEDAWPVIRHYTTAHLTAALGEDAASPTGLEPESAACFDPRVASYRSAE